MPAGRPRTLDSPEQFEERAEAYFLSTEAPTICGLALAVGLTSRQRLFEYANRKEYSDSVKRAKLRVEASYEQSLRGNNAAGPIFALKNFGWQDNQNHQHQGEVRVVIDTSWDNDEAGPELIEAKTPKAIGLRDPIDIDTIPVSPERVLSDAPAQAQDQDQVQP